MAAAAVAAQRAAQSQLSFVGRRGSKEDARGNATRQLPDRGTWILEGSDDIIEQFNLLEIEGLSMLSEAGEAYGIGRRGSQDPDHTTMRAHTLALKEEERPAFVFKMVDAGGIKRRFCFATQNPAEAQRWITSLKATTKEAREVERKKNYGKWVIQKFHKFYNSPRSQFFLAIVIISNFVVAIVKAQLAPEGVGELAENLELLDYAYTGFFIIELLINMIGNWFIPFWLDWWNLFDVAIVLISVLSIPLSNVKGFSLLRMMRVFRVVKLFQSLKSLRTIITALTKAIIPVANAFMVLAILTAIYAVVGVGLYSEVDVVAFGDFSSSLFTMFQVCTGDGWATAIARPMFAKFNEPHNRPQTSITIFFVSYILIVGTFLLNVVVAVLLDEFISAVQSGKTEARMAAQQQKKHNTALDPLLATFASSENSKDLSNRIRQVYEVLDGDDSGGLSFEEMRDGLTTRLITDPVIYLAPENYDAMTEQETLCNSDGELDLEAFELVMRKQLDLYAQRRAAFEMAEAEHSQTTVAAILLLLKQLMLSREESEQRKLEGQRRMSLEKKMRREGQTGKSPLPHLKGVRSPGVGMPAYRQRGGVIQHESSHSDPVSDDLPSDEEDGHHNRGRPYHNGRQRLGDDEEGSPDPDHRHHHHHHHRVHTQDLSRIEGTVQDMQNRMDAMQADMSTLVRTVREGFENQKRQLRHDHAHNGSAADYNGIGIKLEPDKEIVLIAVQEVQQRLSTLESRIASFEGLQRNVGTKVLNRVQSLEQKLETVYKGVAKLAKGGFSATESAGSNDHSRQPNGQRAPSAPEASAHDAKQASSAAAGGAGRHRGRRSDGPKGLIAPPQALEISAMEQAYYDDKSQFVGAAATQLMIAGMEEGKGRGRSESTFSPRKERSSSMRAGKDGPMVTAELGYDLPVAAKKGGGAAGRPPFVVSGDRGPSEHTVRVSWVCTPKGLSGMAEPPIEMTCEGCRRCNDGYVGVGCLICGDKMALVAATDELGGATVGGLELMVTKAHRILRRYGFVDKVVDPSRFVDSPSGDGQHWYRCFIIAEDPIGKG